MNDKAPTCDNLEDTGVENACGSVAGFATSGLNHTRSGLGKPIHYLDLERPSDIAKLADPELYLGKFADHLVILDEIQRLPDLFPVLQSLLDERRRAGEAFGQFLILGSASPELLRQSSETLASRISYLELSPFNLTELKIRDEEMDRQWIRGG